MNCPECDASLAVPDDADAGEIISCPDCGADYELAGGAGGSGSGGAGSGSGFSLKPAEKVGEDWGE